MNRELSLALRAMPAAAIKRRERRVADHIPLAAVVDDEILETRDGDLMTVIRFAGVSHQTAETTLLNAWAASRAHVFQTIATPDVGLYYHYVRREISEYPEGRFSNAFAAELDAAWRESIESRRQFVGEHLVTVVLRPAASKVAGVFRRRSEIGSEARMRAIAKLRDVLRGIIGGLKDYGPEILRVEDGRPEALAFFSYLVSGQHRAPAALPLGPAGEAVATHRISFGRETVELRGPTQASTRLATVISVKDYTPSTWPGMLDQLAPVAAEYVITQSFAPVARDQALNRMATQRRKMAAAEDAAKSLADELEIAADNVAAGRSVMGHHHMTVTVFGDTPAGLIDATSAVATALTDIGFTPVREDVNLEPAFWAMLPGNFVYAARAALITSENLASFVSLHSYPAGAATGHWGPPITLFETVTATPYRFHLHARDVGNTVLFGPTGSGKTVLLAFLIAQSERVNPRIIVIDKDRGAEIVLRALGGRYVGIEPGRDAELNPFLIAEGATPGEEAETRAFLREWVTTLLYGAETAPPQAIEAIRIAVDQVRDAPREARRLELLGQSLAGGPSGPDLMDRLRAWVGTGERAWAFNSATDRFGDLFAERIIGIDVTKILDDPRTRAPWMAYLFSRIEAALDEGERTLIVLDEAWRLLSDDIFAARIQDWLKTIRKKNGAVIFATQEPEDAVASAVGRTIIQQSPTRLLLPNPRASRAAYIEGLGVTEAEYDVVRRTPLASRLMLICHDQDSVIARFDLGDLSEYLAVLSARAETVREVDDLRRRHGDDPAAWLPDFLDRRRRP